MKEHDKLALRLALILTRLFQGQKMRLSDLCHEFNVSERTVQRDLNNRLSYLPIERDGNLYWLAAGALPRPVNTNIQQSLKHLGLDGLLPTDALVSLWGEDIAPILFKQAHTNHDPLIVSKLIQAINLHRIVVLWLAERMIEVEPYKLIYQKAQWYLAASWQDRLFYVSLSDIQQCSPLGLAFQPAKQFQQLVHMDSPTLLYPIQQDVVVDMAERVADFG